MLNHSLPAYQEEESVGAAPGHAYFLKNSHLSEVADFCRCSLRSQNLLSARFSGIQLGNSEWPVDESLPCLSQASTPVILLGSLTSPGRAPQAQSGRCVGTFPRLFCVGRRSSATVPLVCQHPWEAEYTAYRAIPHDLSNQTPREARGRAFRESAHHRLAVCSPCCHITQLAWAPPHPAGQGEGAPLVCGAP